MLRHSAVLGDAQLGSSAVVFAPHPDDETLGCGGTVLAKSAAGARVDIVVLTDGGAWPWPSAGTELVVTRRAAEVREACRRLQIPTDAVHLLGLQDRRVKQDFETAFRLVTELLDRCRPAEVYVPRIGDGHADHEATTAAVLAAIQRSGRPVDVLEYPIWGWLHWPWVPIARPTIPSVRRAFRDARAVGFDLALSTNVVVDARELMAGKRYALEAHSSQITPPSGDPASRTLGDICDGAFLEHFFWGYEPFRRTRVPSR